MSDILDKARRVLTTYESNAAFTPREAVGEVARFVLEVDSITAVLLAAQEDSVERWRLRADYPEAVAEWMTKAATTRDIRRRLGLPTSPKDDRP